MPGSSFRGAGARPLREAEAVGVEVLGRLPPERRGLAEEVESGWQRHSREVAVDAISVFRQVLWRVADSRRRDLGRDLRGGPAGWTKRGLDRTRTERPQRGHAQESPAELNC
jgi:hypothetical protein